MQMRSTGTAFDGPPMGDGQPDYTAASTKRSCENADDALPLAKRPRLTASGSESTTRFPSASADAFASSALTRLSAMPAELLYAIASTASLRDYFSLIQTDSATLEKCRRAPEWLGILIEQIGLSHDGSDIANALAVIGTKPAKWHAPLLRYLACETRRIELGTATGLRDAWQRMIDAACLAQEGLSDGPMKDATLRDLVITRLYQPGLPETLEEVEPDVDAIRAMASLPMLHWPAIFTAHAKIFDDHPVLTQFALSYDGSTAPHPISVSLARKVTRRLVAAPETCNVSEHLARRFGLNEAFQRRHLDATMADVIVQSHPGTYDALVAQCEQWRAGDDVFRGRVEQSLIQSHASMIVMDRFGSGRETVCAVSSDAMRVHFRPFIRDAEQETIDALGQDPDLTAVFLDHCERISPHNRNDSFDTLLALVEGAPWQMQPVLLHRLAHRLNDLHLDGRALAAALDGFEKAVIRCTKQCIDGKSPALRMRTIAALIDSEAAYYRYDFAYTQDRIKRIFDHYTANTMSADWGHALKALANLPKRTSPTARGTVIEELIPEDALATSINYFLRDPETRLSRMDAKLFGVIKVQLAKIWDMLPDAAEKPSERAAAFANRMGLSESQREELHWHLLDSQVDRVANGESDIDRALLRFGFTGAEDRRYVEDGIWTLLVRDWLSLSGSCSKWMGDVVATSSYLTEKVRIFTAKAEVRKGLIGV